MTDAELGGVLAERARRQPRAQRGCPEAERLAELATGPRSQATRESLLAHLETCPDCVAELAAAAAARDLVAPALADPSPVGRRRWLPLAAAFFLGLVGLLVYRGFERAPSEYRTAEDSRWPVVPADGAELASAPRELSWRRVEGAMGYRVELFDAAFTRLAESGDLTEPSFALPSELRLAPGASYFWRVELRGPRVAERARTFSFRLAP